MDLFATQFSFSIQNQRNGKQTIVGQSLSAIIVITSFLYLFYLMFNYFDGNHLPKITEVTEVNQFSNEIEYGNESPFSIRLFFQDQKIPENFDLNKYIKVVVKYGQVWEGNTVDIELQKCIDLYPTQKQFYNDLDLCLEKNIFLQNQYNEQFDYYTDTSANIFIYQCEGVNCATQLEIENIINNYQMVGLFKIRLKEFDYKSKSLKDVIIEKYITFNINQFSSNRYIMQKSTIDIDDGILLSNKQSFTYINDYVEENDKVQTLTKDKYPQFINYKMLGLHSFLIHMNNKQINVEYPKITESLAQFVSVFNILSIIGFIAKFCSEVKIFEQIMDNHVKFYYQKMINLTPETKTDNIFDYNIFQSVQNFIKNSYYQKYYKKQQKIQTSQNFNQKNFIYQNLYKIVEEQIDLDNIFKEILFLKTCVQTLMTQEQYAAVRYCGRNPPLNPQIETATNLENTNNIQTLNHLEQLDLIDKNPIICETFLQQFIQQNNLKNNYNNIEQDNQSPLILQDNIQQKNQLNNQNQQLTKQNITTNDIIYNSLLNDQQIKILQNKLYKTLKNKLIQNTNKLNNKIKPQVQIENLVQSQSE